jgi:predicted DNA-binding protein with PD1-like motif
MQIHTIRLKPGDEIRSSLMNFARGKNLSAASIVTCAGAVEKANLRMAGATPNREDEREFVGPFEVVSLAGTFSVDDCHFHIALSDKNGQVIGGHLRSATVGVIAEIVILNDETVRYAYPMDEQIGFTGLEVRNE